MVADQIERNAFVIHVHESLARALGHSEQGFVFHRAHGPARRRELRHPLRARGRFGAVTAAEQEAAAFAGQWYSVVPFFGGLLAWLANLALVTAGLRERFRVSNRRAAAVVLAPYILLFFLGFLVLILAVFALTQLPFQDMIGDLRLGRLAP